MTKRRRKSEPTGLELFLYWWAEHSGHEEAPQKQRNVTPPPAPPQDAPYTPPSKEHPIGTQEMVGVVAENYRRGKPVASYAEGFRDGAEWVLNMDAVTLRYLRGELTNE